MQKIQITVLYQSNDNCSKRENMRQVRDRRQNKKINRIEESLVNNMKRPNFCIMMTEEKYQSKTQSISS